MSLSDWDRLRLFLLKDDLQYYKYVVETWEEPPADANPIAKLMAKSSLEMSKTAIIHLKKKIAELECQDNTCSIDAPHVIQSSSTDTTSS